MSNQNETNVCTCGDEKVIKTVDIQKLLPHLYRNCLKYEIKNNAHLIAMLEEESRTKDREIARLLDLLSKK